jgi:glycerophosphoryl diester phosphodiesterase
VIAHRCGGVLAPENTLAGLRAAAAGGCRAVEFDAMLSADGTPFLIHDETLDRTTDGRGEVARTPDATLRSLDAGRWFGADFAGEPLPTLAQAIRLCGELDLWANVEIKPAAGHDVRTGEMTARLVADQWRGRAPLLSSFSEIALEAARRAAPMLPYALLVRDLPADWRARLERLGCAALHVAARHTTPAGIRAVREAGYGYACYTVNDPALARRLFGDGVDAVFTDRPDLLVSEASI